MAMNTEILHSASKFAEAITKRLREKVEEEIDEMREDLRVEGAQDDEEEVELGFADSDIEKVKKIADDLGLEYSHDEESGDFELSVGDDVDDETVDKFFDKLEAADINWTEDDESDEDDEIDEAAPKRKKIKANIKNKRKRDYRKNKAKIKIKQKRRRKTSAFKRYKKKAKIKARSGRTASGKRKTKFL